MANLLSEAVDLYHQRTALSDGRHSFTFGEIDRFSTQFATFLLANGLAKGDRVACCSPKSAPLVVAILGCLKAGGIYVPMDSKLPADRLLFILNDVAPRFIIAAGSLYGAVAAGLDRPSGLIEEADLAELFAGSGAAMPLPDIADEDVAYCLYTSGSTGRPKGVLIEHGSLDAFYRALAEIMPITPDCRCMNTSELYFDVHVMDLFFPLHRGAPVHLACAPMVANKLLRILEQQRITHFTAVGPLMTLMSEGSAFNDCDLSSLVRVMTGAEVINVQTMQKWLAKVAGLTLVNGYGPTEGTVICTAHIIDRREPDRVTPYPIGKPMKDSVIVLVDGDRLVTEPECAGELLIGGPQVMKGYLNDARQTADRIAVIDGRRYYRSGDLCEWSADGNLKYLGRKDDEIKLSGYRINLNEIKRVMDAARGVREGHPVVVIHPRLGKVIAACFMRAAGATGEGDKLFGHLQSAFRKELPYYMVPSLYVEFDSFPASPSGKTDKQKMLAAIDQYLLAGDVSATRFTCYAADVRAALADAVQ